MTPPATTRSEYDVAIVGAGPAGLSAATWLGRYLRSVIVVDAGDPRNWETRGINGILGHQGIPPAELRHKGREEAASFGVTFADGEVTSACHNADCIRLTLRDESQIVAKRVLLAFGIQDIWPDVPGLQRCYGETAHVCPDCDGYEARGKKTLVIGTGRRAVGMALALTTWTRQVIVCTNGKPPDISSELCEKLDALNIPVIEAVIRRITSSQGNVQIAELEGGMQLDCQHVFFSLGQVAADDLGTQLGCKRDDDGLIVVDEHNATSVESVFAAGDITPGPQLAIIAAAEGAVAALAIHRSLLPEGQKL